MFLQGTMHRKNLTAVHQGMSKVLIERKQHSTEEQSGSLSDDENEGKQLEAKVTGD